MPTDIEIRVTGICAFVNASPSVKVVMVDARNPTPAEGEPHYAALLTPRSALDRTSPRPIDFGIDAAIPGFDSSDRDYVGFWLEGGENLNLNNPVGNVPLALNNLTGCPGQADSRIDWISRMANAGNDHFNAHAPVLASFMFTDGTLEAEQFALIVDPSGNRKNVLWQFADPNGSNADPRIGALADVIKLSMPGVPVSPIEISSSLGAGKKIVFASPLPLNQLRIWIVNLPLLDILSARPASVAQADMHFAHFHKLSTMAGTRIPLPQGICAQGGGTGGVLNPKCPPTYFS